MNGWRIEDLTGWSSKEKIVVLPRVSAARIGSTSSFFLVYTHHLKRHIGDSFLCSTPVNENRISTGYINFVLSMLEGWGVENLIYVDSLLEII